MKRLWLNLFVVAATLSCHSPKLGDPVGGNVQESDGVIAVRVINRNQQDVQVYFTHDGIRTRIGLAVAATSTDFTVPVRSLGAGREYRLIGYPVGSRLAVQTEVLHGRPGDEVTWSLEDSFARSTVVVR